MLADEEIFVRDTERAELARIHAMEQGDARSFIIPYSLERHELEFGSQGVFYKSIWVDRQIIGFLILALDSDGRSIEFRRIVLSETGRGYGKKVVTMVDEICRQEFGRTRLWLDVLSRIHERAMYMTSVAITFSDVSEHEGRTLLLYEKACDNGDPNTIRKSYWIRSENSSG
jgi:hypothetical protein